MKNLFFIFIFFPTFCFSQNVDETKGFKSGLFGMNENELRNKTVVYESTISKTYKNEKEDLTFGGYSFFQIDYAFFENKLWKISAHCSGSENITGILKMLYKSYGNCETENIPAKKDILMFVWNGKNVSVSLVTFDDFTSAKLVFTDKILEKKLVENFKNFPENQKGFHELIEGK